jgi:hypothetical protein
VKGQRCLEALDGGRAAEPVRRQRDGEAMRSPHEHSGCAWMGRIDDGDARRQDGEASLPPLPDEP